MNIMVLGYHYVRSRKIIFKILDRKSKVTSPAIHLPELNLDHVEKQLIVHTAELCLKLAAFV